MALCLRVQVFLANPVYCRLNVFCSLDQEQKGGEV